MLISSSNSIFLKLLTINNHFFEKPKTTTKNIDKQTYKKAVITKIIRQMWLWYAVPFTFRSADLNYFASHTICKKNFLCTMNVVKKKEEQKRIIFKGGQVWMR